VARAATRRFVSVPARRGRLDTAEVADDESRLAPILRLLLAGASAVVVLVGMHWSAHLLVPLILTAMVLLATTPIVLRLQQRGVPPRIAVLGLYVVLAVIGVVLLLYFGLLLRRFGNNLPAYSTELDLRLADVEQSLADLGLPVDVGQIGSDVFINAATWVTNQLIATVQTALFVFPAALLILLESPQLIARIPREIGADDRLTRALNTYRDSIIGFMAVSTRIGLILGGLVTVMLFLLGVDFPIFFGILTFFATYIPSLGLLIAAIPAITMSWVQYGWGRAALVAIGFMMLSMVVGSTMQRGAMTRRLNLSGGVIFLGAFFWAWVLGPAGALLAAPIMALIKLVLESSSQTRWLAVIMSQGMPDTEGTPAPEHGATLPAPESGREQP
jgi:predicted PurR-regulated permease PerM